MLRGKGGRPGSDARLIPLTVPEVRRLITRLVSYTIRLTLFCRGPNGDGGIRPEPSEVITNAGYHYGKVVLL